MSRSCAILYLIAKDMKEAEYSLARNNVTAKTKARRKIPQTTEAWTPAATQLTLQTLSRSLSTNKIQVFTLSFTFLSH